MSFVKSTKYEHFSDTELVLSFKKEGNNDALGGLYQRYMELIYGLCIKYLKDRELAKDAVLNIYEELVQKLPKYEVTNFKSWLYTLAKNHCLMYLRSPKNKPTKEYVPEVMHLEETVHLNGEMEDEANFNKLEKCLQSLATEQGKTVKMFYYEQKCYKEIASETGYDVNMIRSFIQNGRRNLKICMEKS